MSTLPPAVTKPNTKNTTTDRLAQIVRCCDEMDYIRTHYPPNALLNTLGQLDWLDELHRILYGP